MDYDLRPRRQIRRDVRPALSKYAALVGEVTYSSNSLHATFYLLFLMLFELDQEAMVAAIWHSLRSDDAQRNILRMALENYNKPLGTRRTKALLWAVDKAGKLAGFRNDAIHTNFEYGPNGKGGFVIYPSEWSAEPRRLKKLTMVNHTRLFRLLIGDLNSLCEYVGLISEILLPATTVGDPVPPHAVPLPKRPPLRSIQLVQQSPPKSSNRQQHRAKRRRQRKSSQAKP